MIRRVQVNRLGGGRHELRIAERLQRFVPARTRAKKCEFEEEGGVFVKWIQKHGAIAIYRRLRY